MGKTSGETRTGTADEPGRIRVNDHSGTGVACRHCCCGRLPGGNVVCGVWVAMAIRVRRVDGVLVALCAAKTEAVEGDLYLDDGIHYALSQKLWRDYPEIGTVDPNDIALAAQEEKKT